MRRTTLLEASMLRVMVFLFGIVGISDSSDVQCQLQNGKCTYNIDLRQEGSCSENLGEVYPYSKPEGMRLPADEKMNILQTDFAVVKSDHEDRIKELENSIQKVLGNAFPSVPDENSKHRVHVTTTYRYVNKIESKLPSQEASGNILHLQLHNKLSTLSTPLSQRTADLLDARNAVNETTELLQAAQKQAFESNSKVVNLKTKSTVLGRENSILKNKIKDKTERLENAKDRLDTTNTQLTNTENQFYDVVRSDATVKEELETVKHLFRETQIKLMALQRNDTELQAKYKKESQTLKTRDEELLQCNKGC